MTLTHKQAALLLTRLPKIGSRTAKKLIDHYRTPQKLFTDKAIQRAKIRGIGQLHLQAFNNWKDYLPQLKTEEKKIKKSSLEVQAYGEKTYPLPLSFTADPPIAFFQLGQVNWKNPRILSIVGTRSPTRSGLALCSKLIEELVPFNPLIVSGFARGIDIEAHRTALKYGLETVAVLGHAFGEWYPKEHEKWVGQFLQKGAFVSEFWSDMPFERHNFLKRNRIIAGLSHATIVIESGEQGGSLVTAQHALRYGREVFAFPGRSQDTKSAGCLNLIKQDKARLITSAQDVVDWLEWSQEKQKAKTIQKQLFVELNEKEKALYAILEEEKSLDELAFSLGWSIARTATCLTQLELQGVVRPLANKRYERT